jgi:hypothetical protein
MNDRHAVRHEAGERPVKDRQCHRGWVVLKDEAREPQIVSLYREEIGRSHLPEPDIHPIDVLACNFEMRGRDVQGDDFPKYRRELGRHPPNTTTVFDATAEVVGRAVDAPENRYYQIEIAASALPKCRLVLGKASRSVLLGGQDGVMRRYHAQGCPGFSGLGDDGVQRLRVSDRLDFWRRGRQWHTLHILPKFRRSYKAAPQIRKVGGAPLMSGHNLGVFWLATEDEAIGVANVIGRYGHSFHPLTMGFTLI